MAYYKRKEAPMQYIQPGRTKSDTILVNMHSPATLLAACDEIRFVRMQQSIETYPRLYIAFCSLIMIGIWCFKN